MPYVFKKIDDIDYAFSNELYNRFFYDCVVYADPAGYCVLIYPTIDQKFAMGYEIKMKEMVDMINRKDEALLNHIVKAGYSFQNLMKDIITDYAKHDKRYF